MKIIDLLKRCAEHDVTLPEKIMYADEVFERVDTNGKGHFYYQSTSTCTNFLELINYFVNLNKEVKIIGEEKEIEKLDVALLGQCDNWLQHQETKEHSCLELNPYIIDNIRENTLYFQKKINELIDTINELKGKSE